MLIDNIISQAVSRAVNALYGVDTPWEQIVPQATRKEFEGNLTVVTFPWVKAARKSPEQVGTEIGNWLVDNEPAVNRFNVIKGFLNIVIEPTYWNAVLRHVAETPDYGLVAPTDESPLVMVEYSSPNTNKPLHLGHVRNNLLGFSLAQILEACGNKVVKTNIVNDRGIHICKSMLAWQKWGNGATPESTGKKGDHLIGDFYVLFDKHYKEELNALKEQGLSDEEAAAQSPLMAEAREMLRRWEQGDPEVRALWEMMNGWVYAGFDETYKRMGVGFDKIYYESQTYLEGKEKVMEGLEKGIMYRKDDGSVWADLTADGLDHKLLLRADGTSVYMTQDIGTAKLRYQDYPKACAITGYFFSSGAVKLFANVQCETGLRYTASYAEKSGQETTFPARMSSSTRRYASLVEECTPGKTKTKCTSVRGAIDRTTSPRPDTSAAPVPSFPQCRKKNTSLPTCPATASAKPSASGMPCTFASTRKNAAASEEPPPRPPPIGIRLRRRTCTPASQPVSWQNAAYVAVKVLQAGRTASPHSTTHLFFSAIGETVSSSHTSTV